MRLTPREEAVMVCYIAIYYNCDTQEIADIIQKYGSTTSRIVYRGQAKKDTTIDNRKPFVSTSPSREMAEQFVEHDWEANKKVGNLFTIHLENAKWLSTRSIEFTLTDEVKEELRKINSKPIQKERDYTLDEFWPQINTRLAELLAEGEEILVLTGGTLNTTRYSVGGRKTRKSKKSKRRVRKTRRRHKKTT